MSTNRQASDNAGVVDQILDAAGQGDLDSLLSFYHPDAVVREPRSLPHGGEHRGLDQVRAAAIARSETWGPFQETTKVSPEPEVFALDDNMVAARWRLQARGDAADLDVEAIDIYRLRSGKVLELETYYRDTAAMTRFLAEQRVHE